MRPSRAAVAALLVVLTGLPLVADDLDGLFDNNNPDTVVATPANTVASGSILGRPVFLYFGNLETQGAFINGFKSVDSQEITPSYLLYLRLQGGIDVEPIPQARIIGTFSSFLPQGLNPTTINNLKNGTTQTGVTGATPETVNTTSSLALDEMYLDYTIMDSASFRVGEFIQTWGQGRIFNPGNLVVDTSGGAINLKAFYSAGPMTFTGLAIANPTYFADKSKPQANEMGYAGALGFSAGEFTGGVSSFFQQREGLSADASLKTSFWGFDIYGEVLAYRRPYFGYEPGYLVGFYRELDIGLHTKWVAEYWDDGRQIYTASSDLSNRSVGIGVLTDPVISGLGLKFNGKWIHSLSDGSGQLVVGFDISPLPKMDIAFGVPWTYGKVGTVYVAGNADPEQRYLSTVLTVTVKLDFEKDR